MESREIRLRRLHMRSMRRGTKEMDLILMGFAGAALEGLDPEELDAYEALLEENDQDLYAWIAGQTPGPERHAAMIARIRALFPAAARTQD